MSKKKKGFLHLLITGSLVFAGSCLLLTVLIQLINARQPTRSSLVDRLSTTDKFRLAEVFQLRKTLGDQVMPGWAQVEIPVIIFNEEYLFLVGCQEPAPGWRKVPQGTPMGQVWEVVPGDDFYGQPYYRQKHPASGVTTENFTVRVGDRWVASLMSLDWMKISLVSELRKDLPALLQPMIPYPLAVSLLVPDSDTFITGVLHEAMHAYQGIRAPKRLADAEETFRRLNSQYPWEDQVFQKNWQAELDLLHEAMRVSSGEETLQLARAFLRQRAERRSAAKLTMDLIDFERQREWEEGIAKYAERYVYLLASQKESYQPLPELNQDPEFHHYQRAQQKWKQEIDQIRRMAGDKGDGRFYYSGFAQVVLLDRLDPDWKDRLFEDGVWLEDLLAEAAGMP